MKKIAIVTSGFKPVPDVEGGAVEHLTTVLIDQNEKYCDYQLDVYTLASTDLKKLEYHNAKLLQIRNWQHFLPVRAVFSIVNRTYNLLHKKKRFDYMSVIIPKRVKGNYNLVVVENNLMIFFALRKKMPHTNIVFHLHNDFDTVDEDYDKTAKRMKELGDQATAIWTASYYLKRHLESLQLKATVSVLENCVDKDRYQDSKKTKQNAVQFRKKYAIKPDEFVVLFSGRLDKWKGALEILKAVELLKEKKIKLVIAGTQWFGSRNESIYVKEINEVKSRINDKVILCGQISQEEMQFVYQAADLVVIPSQCIEAFGMTALEAITMGKPCVASACGGLMDILNESCARFIPQGEKYADRLADIISELYGNPELLKKMGKNARKRAENFMDETQYYNQFKVLVESLE